MSATSIDQLLHLVQSLTTEGVSYGVEGSTVTATVADEPFVIAELDGEARTFRFLPVKSARPDPRTPAFEAGGVYNLAKRGGMLGRKPSQLRVKAGLAELFTKHGWTKVR